MLQVIPSLVSGGAERGTVEMAAALVACRMDCLCRLVRRPDGARSWRAPARSHIKLPLASKNPLVMRRNAARAEATLSAGTGSTSCMRAAAPRHGARCGPRAPTRRRFVTTFHNAYDTDLPLKRWYNSVMARGERVIAISQFVGEHAASTYGIGPDRLRVIPRGVDLASFDPHRVRGDRVAALARQWRVPDDVKIVMLPGRLTRWKGGLDFIEAIARLGRRDLCCLLVGAEQRPGFRRELEAAIERLGLVGMFRIVDHCRDMPAAYMLSDVVVSASNEPEGFGRVIIEAQAMGRPVVATDHGGARETILPGITGWLAAPGDPARAGATRSARRWRSTMRRALPSRGARCRISRPDFTSELMCARTIDVYEELLFPQARDRRWRPDAGAAGDTGIVRTLVRTGRGLDAAGARAHSGGLLFPPPFRGGPPMSVQDVGFDRPVAWPSNGISEVPFRLYTDPEQYRLEQERIFKGPTWSYLCLAGEIPEPGDWVATTVGEVAVIVARGADGAINAFVNRCAHRGNLLCLTQQGPRQGNHLHLSRLELRSRRPPDRRSRSSTASSGRAAWRPSSARRNTICSGCGSPNCAVSCSARSTRTCEDLETYLGPLVVGGLKRVLNRPFHIIGRSTQILPNNWKLYFENVKDTYHASILHSFLTTFRINRLSMPGSINIDESGGHHFSQAKLDYAAEDADYKAAQLRSDTDLKLRDPSIVQAHRRIRRSGLGADPDRLPEHGLAAGAQHDRGARDPAARRRQERTRLGASRLRRR